MIKTDPNPQGKGLVPVLECLSSARPRRSIPPKKIDRIAGELFTSLFVLESEFFFKPVAGRIYYLYRREKMFRLSLISPDEWIGEQFGKYIGECRLEDDMTWTLLMDRKASRDEDLIRHISERKREFDERLESAERLEDVLPVYYGSLPFYRRLFASALAHSLGVSMELSGIRTLTYAEAKGLLE